MANVHRRRKRKEERKEKFRTKQFYFVPANIYDRGLKKGKDKVDRNQIVPGRSSLKFAALPSSGKLRPPTLSFPPTNSVSIERLESGESKLNEWPFPAINVPRRSDVPRPWAGGMSRGMFSARKGRQGRQGRWNVTRWTFPTHTDRLGNASREAPPRNVVVAQSVLSFRTYFEFQGDALAVKIWPSSFRFVEIRP